MVSVDLVSISVQKCKANEKKLAARLLWTPSDCMQNLEPFSKCSRGTVIFIQNIEQILNVKLQHTSKSVAGNLCFGFLSKLWKLLLNNFLN